MTISSQCAMFLFCLVLSHTAVAWSARNARNRLHMTRSGVKSCGVGPRPRAAAVSARVLHEAFAALRSSRTAPPRLVQAWVRAFFCIDVDNTRETNRDSVHGSRKFNASAHHKFLFLTLNAYTICIRCSEHTRGEGDDNVVVNCSNPALR